MTASGQHGEPSPRRYALVHRTTYTYDQPVTSSYGRTALTPRELPDQVVERTELEIQPAPADREAHLDYFGNRSTYFAVTAPHRRLVVTSRSTVAVARVARSVATLPVVPWEDVAGAVRAGGASAAGGRGGAGVDDVGSGATGAGAARDDDVWDGVVRDDVADVGPGVDGPADGPADGSVAHEPRAARGQDGRDGLDGIGIVALREAVLASRHVSLDDAVRAWAEPSFTPGRPLAEILAELARRIRSELTYRSGSTTVRTTQRELLTQGAGVCQDFAHLMVAALRAHGLPARYTSGYLETRPAPGKVKLRGADASHAWVSAWVPGAGWVEIDPTNDCFVDDRYVILGWGRDYADVPPLRGVIFTEGSGSRLTVSVDLAPVDDLSTPPG